MGNHEYEYEENLLNKSSGKTPKSEERRTPHHVCVMVALCVCCVSVCPVAAHGATHGAAAPPVPRVGPHVHAHALGDDGNAPSKKCHCAIKK